MNNITLPNFHLLKASDLINIILDQLRPDFASEGIELHMDVADNLFCEAEQDQFVNTLLYIIDLTRSKVASVKDNPTIWVSASNDDNGFVDISVRNNYKEIDLKSAEAASSSTAVILNFEFDSNLGNGLILSFSTLATGGEHEVSTSTISREAALGENIELPR